MPYVLNEIFLLQLVGTQKIPSPVLALWIFKKLIVSNNCSFLIICSLFGLVEFHPMCVCKLVFSQRLNGPSVQVARKFLRGSSFLFGALLCKFYHPDLPELPPLFPQLRVIFGLCLGPPPCTVVWKLPPTTLSSWSQHNGRAYLICFLSLRDHNPTLPVVQYPKTVLYILSSFLFVYSRRVILDPTVPSWLEAEVLFTLYWVFFAV